MRRLGEWMFAALWLVGCGSSNNIGPLQGPQTPTAPVTFTHVLAQAVSTEVQTFRLLGRDSQGSTTLSPQIVPKSTNFTLDFPVSTTSIFIEYLDVSSQTRGVSVESVVLAPGQPKLVEVTDLLVIPDVDLDGEPTLAWQNPSNQFDVDNDGQVTPKDALVLANDLNLLGSRPLIPGTDAPPPPFLDVNGNAAITPVDLLLVINHLNNRQNP